MKVAHRGFLMLLALVFGAIFLVVMGGLTSFILSENRLQNIVASRNQAFAVAEAGLEYYRWFLAHFPNDTTNGTGHAGPYVISYTDPEGGTAGTISLAIQANQSCGQTTSIDLTSTGTSADGMASRTIFARYARPTVGEYSYVLNASVWAGSDRVILGPYHSNGGIRMDGTANSPVTSSLSSWLCTSSFGCSPNQTKNGVWGAGTNQNLWDYPTPQVNFEGIAADFSSLESTATAQGLHFDRYSSGNGGVSFHKGYHLIFNANGTLTVKRVTNEYVLTAYPIDGSSSWTDDYTRIKSETTYNTYTIPASCAVIFVQDHTWIEGTITRKITVVAADVVHSGVDPDVMLPGNITYAAYDGSAGLTVIAEHNILITPDSPQNMTLNGIFVAQGGAFGRNLYDCPSSYEPRGTLTILGTTVSNKRTGTKWLNGCGSGNDAGYQTRIDSYDRRIASDPPPFTPVVSSDFRFMDWREE